MPLSQPADACLAFIAAQPNDRMLLLSCSNDHNGLFGSMCSNCNADELSFAIYRPAIYRFSSHIVQQFVEAGYHSNRPAILLIGS